MQQLWEAKIAGQEGELFVLEWRDHPKLPPIRRPRLELALVHPNPNIFHPLPGTPLYRDCLAAGLVVDEAGHRVWSEQDIARERTGPLRGVDYGRVLATYYRYRPECAPPGGFTPWVMAPGAEPDRVAPTR